MSSANALRKHWELMFTHTEILIGIDALYERLESQDSRAFDHAVWMFGTRTYTFLSMQGEIVITLYPTNSPIFVLVSKATLFASAIAAIRRGCVT